MLDMIEYNTKLKSVIEKSIILFNQSPLKGIEFGFTEGLIQNKKPSSIANFLLTTPGLNKQILGEYLGNNN